MIVPGHRLANVPAPVKRSWVPAVMLVGLGAIPLAVLILLTRDAVRAKRRARRR